MNSDTKPTLDERIEALQKKIQLQRQSDHDFYGKSFIREDEVTAALAIIDELRNDKLAESREDMAHAEVERLRVRIDELEAENARLKDVYESAVDGRRRFRQSYREARAENARLREIAEYTRKIRVTVHDPDDWIVLGRLLDEDARARR